LPCRYYKKVCKPTSLRRAWQKVYENGIKSKSEQTQKDVRNFANKSDRNLDRIYRKLLRKEWEFEPALGIFTRSHSGKKQRPLVVSPIENRIIQRSILDVLQKVPAIKAYYEIESSFGGIEGKSVRAALEKVYLCIKNGACYYIRSDIKDFFTNIPKDIVLSIIAKHISDRDFNTLLLKATKVELRNLHELKESAKAFPLYEIGVAQGCCLSPLIGNILLHDFDIEMNDRGISCIRYIDDFIMLGDNLSHLNRAFKNAKRLLGALGLEVHDPDVNKGKADLGNIKNGFNFLGCIYTPGLLRPNSESCNRLLTHIDTVLKDSITMMREPKKLYDKRKSLIRTLIDVDNILMGWGNQYSFCNNEQVFKHIDSEVDKKIQNYLGHYAKIKNALKNEIEKNRKRLLGIFIIEENKSDPIIKANQDK